MTEVIKELTNPERDILPMVFVMMLALGLILVVLAMFMHSSTTGIIGGIFCASAIVGGFCKWL